jgi:integrase
LRHDINQAGGRQGNRAITLRELFDHYRQRELGNGNTSKTPSTKHTYEGYITKWICPRWGSFPLARVRAGEVEQWLHSLPLAPASCAKIRNVMNVLFNHAIRHDLFDRNAIRWVRQSAKRTKAPTVLSASEIKSLLPALSQLEQTLVLLDSCTSLRMSELFALKWSDVDFEAKQMDRRSDF